MKKYIFGFLALVVLVAGAFYVVRRSPVVINVEPPEKPAEVKKEPPRLTLMFMGDVMLDRDVEKEILAAKDWRFPFLRIASTTSAADLAFLNLETTISARGRKIGSIYSFRSDPQVIEGLKYAGIDVVSIANNHIWDYAEDAFLDTQTHLRNAGIAYAGGGVDYEAAHSPTVMEVKGTKLAFLAYTNLLPKFFLQSTSTPASASYEDWSRVTKDIEAARSMADIVVVSYHWGEEYKTAHNPEQERIAKATIDAGANLVIGHHPHVQQEIERYKDGYIAYSLGNFVFDQYFSPETMTSRIFEVEIAGNKIVGAKEIPLSINTDYQPEVAGPAKEL